MKSIVKNIKLGMEQFKKWSANHWFVYSIMGISPLTMIYNVAFMKHWSIAISLVLLGIQLSGLILLILSVSIWKKYRNW